MEKRIESRFDTETNSLIEKILEKGVVMGRPPAHRMKKWDGYKFSRKQLQDWREFHDYLKAKGLKPHSRMSYLYFLRDLTYSVRKEYRAITKKDMVSYFASLEGLLGVFTINTRKVYSKVFFRWLYNIKDKRKLPPVIDGEEFDKRKAERLIREEELLTEQEVSRLLDACGSLRNKTIVSLLSECGLRVGELTEIRLQDVSFRDRYCIIRVGRFGKTEASEREIIVVRSANLIRELVNSHPSKEGSAYLFLMQEHPEFSENNTGQKTDKLQGIGRGGVRSIIHRLAKKAGIKKDVYPHIFRFGCATSASDFLNQEEMKARFGWSKNSNMAAHYSAVRKDKMRDKILAHHGVLSEENKEDNHSCPRCGMRNLPGVLFCSGCDAPMRADVAMRQRQEEESRWEKFMLIKYNLPALEPVRKEAARIIEKQEEKKA